MAFREGSGRVPMLPGACMRVHFSPRFWRALRGSPILINQSWGNKAHNLCVCVFQRVLKKMFTRKPKRHVFLGFGTFLTTPEEQIATSLKPVHSQSPEGHSLPPPGCWCEHDPNSRRRFGCDFCGSTPVEYSYCTKRDICDIHINIANPIRFLDANSSSKSRHGRQVG